MIGLGEVIFLFLNFTTYNEIDAINLIPLLKYKLVFGKVLLFDVIIQT
jgi:hypothetical protein